MPSISWAVSFHCSCAIWLFWMVTLAILTLVHVLVVVFVEDCHAPWIVVDYAFPSSLALILDPDAQGIRSDDSASAFQKAFAKHDPILDIHKVRFLLGFQPDCGIALECAMEM